MPGRSINSAPMTLKGTSKIMSTIKHTTSFEIYQPVKELFPLLRKSNEARVINHSSGARLGKPLDIMYFGKNGGNLGGDGNEEENSSFSGPSKINVDKDGNLWVADKDNHRVLVFISPATTDYLADFVFGQGGSFTSNTQNNGGISDSSLWEPSNRSRCFEPD